MRFDPRPFAFGTAALLLATSLTGGALAQERVWIQIEARPTLEQARERAADWDQRLDNVEGYRLRSGWYGIALGPWDVAEGAGEATRLKRANLIPNDSYVTDGREFGEAFWPEAGAAAAAPAVEPAPAIAEPAPVETAPAVVAAPEPEETIREARDAEAALSLEDRQMLQLALQWFGHYQGGIDGAIGPGSRNAMAAWQQSLGLEPTGVLTTRQRATLVANYHADIAEYGFQTVEETEAGINVTLPMALVEFDRYEPPFVHFRPKDGSEMSIVLISQPGDRAGLRGLYDILQTLDDIPTTGERAIRDNQFRIEGTSATRRSLAAASESRGAIRGWMVLSTPGHAERDQRILEVLEQSFRGVGDTVLDPGLVQLDEATRRGLLAGLEIRQAKSAASGFFIAGDGTVLTSRAAVESCARVTIDHDTEARVKLSDAASGIAVLSPERALAPRAFAAFQPGAARLGAEVAVSGYSWGGRLPAPVLTWGTLEDSAGVEGILALKALPGDAGGPLLDGNGGVLGMMLPGRETAGRQLPEGLGLYLGTDRIREVLSAAGVAVNTDARSQPLPPETLSREASGMTVLVSCWE